MKKDVFNLDYHCARLLVKAINRCTSFDEVAEMTKISKTVVYRMLWRYKIKHEKPPGKPMRVLSIPPMTIKDTEGEKLLEIPIQ